MPVKNSAGRKSTKRKQIEEEEAHAELQSHGVLEMLSDEEDDGDASSDDGQVDEFPELVNESSSEDSEYEEDEEEDGEEEEDTEDTENEGANESGAESDDSLHVFPKAKTIISKITKQPKTVYPEIEPNYDSDSSTEDVCNKIFYIHVPSPLTTLN